MNGDGPASTAHTCTACDTPAADHRLRRCDHPACQDPDGGLAALHTPPLCCAGCLCGRYLRVHTPPHDTPAERAGVAARAFAGLLAGLSDLADVDRSLYVDLASRYCAQLAVGVAERAAWQPNPVPPAPTDERHT